MARMSDRPVRVMLDANVIIDAYCRWHPEGSAAKELLGSCDPSRIELYNPVHVLKDVLHVLTQEFKREARRVEGNLSEASVLAAREAAIACMRNMMELATAVGADGSDLWLADKYLPVHHDFEDNLVLAACRRIKVDYLVTSDRALIQNANVLAKTPDQMMALMSVGGLQTFDGLSPDDISWTLRS